MSLDPGTGTLRRTERLKPSRGSERLPALPSCVEMAMFANGRWFLVLLTVLAVGCGSSVEPRVGADSSGGGGGFGSDGTIFGGSDSAGGGGGDSAGGGQDVADAGAPDSADTVVDPSCPGGCDDGVPCTVDACKSGTCTHNLAPGTCYADGQCFSPGPAAGKNCLVCDPAKAQLALVPAPAGTGCDDGSICTEQDACDATGTCAGKPKAGCCKADIDCVVSEPCQVGVCDVGTGTCSGKATPSCCKAGVCCDTGIGAPKTTGHACGTTTVQSDWACDGADKRRRDAVAGCDGTSATGCSTASEHLVWGEWKTASSCPSGQLCVPAAPGIEPSCGTPPECSKQSDCNDGQPCTFDVCDAGKCAHVPEKAGTACGTKVVATEYQCSSPNQGASIQIREGVAACDGQTATCPTTTDKPVFGPWKTFKTCPWTDVCEVSDASQPGVCKGAPKCKPGTTCCTDAGEYAAKGTICADKEVDVESVCEGTAPGNSVKSRVAKPGCSGNGTTCYEFSSSYWVWSEWKVTATCGPKEACEIGWNGTGSCTSKTQCSPSSGCCTQDGFYAAQGSTCSTSSSKAKTEKKCENNAKGGWILQREASYGCSGKGGSCSYASADYVWGEWKQLEQCAKNEACNDSWGYVSCVSAGTCSPSGGCCDETGEYLPKGSQCETSSSAYQTQQQCDGTKIMTREGWLGCSGQSGSCSYSSENIVWGDWKLEKECGPDQTCKGQSFPYCGTP